MARGKFAKLGLASVRDKFAMDFTRLFELAEHARSGRRFEDANAAFVRDRIPEALQDFPNHSLPTKIRHPAGFTVTGAPVKTFIKGALLSCGGRVFGKRYDGSEFYWRVEKELAFRVMRSHFHHGFPKGTHCCAQCTLAVYPVLSAGGIRYFEGRSLADNVRQLVESGGWRFARPPSEAMMRWSLSA